MATSDENGQGGSQAVLTPPPSWDPIIANAMKEHPGLVDPRVKPAGYEALPSTLRFRFDQFQMTVMNQFLSRSDMIARLADPYRDIYQACGLPQKGRPVDPNEYWYMYERNPVADRAVWHVPNDVWQTPPSFIEDEAKDSDTDFEADMKDIDRQLRGEDSWYGGEEGSPFTDVLRRAHAMSRVSRYCALLIGLDDLKEGNEDLTQPAEFVNRRSRSRTGDPTPSKQAVPSKNGQVSTGPKRELLYLRVFPEHLARISELETKNGPRLGLPLMYQMTFAEPGDLSGIGAVIGANMYTKQVHWTRVVHITGQKESSEVFAKPCLRPYFNELMGLEKLYASSPEMYWKGAFMGMGFKNQQGIEGIDYKALKDMMERYQNDMQRWFAVFGLEPVPIAPQVVDCTSQVKVLIQSICISESVPERIFMGSERGEMSSAQDERQNNDRVQGVLWRIAVRE